MRKATVVLCAALASLVAACGSSSSDSADLSGLNRTDVNAGLAPLNNGFSFANFGANATQEQFDVNDLVTMFGAGACIDGVVAPCSPTAQAAAWARMVNDARQSGHCEGLVVQASARFNDNVTPKTAELPRDNDVIHAVYRAFATQFLPEVQDSTSEWADRTLVDIVNELVASLADGTTDYSMGLYGEQGGHAVLPYSVQFTDDNLAVIGVYDSNWPGMERYVVVDFDENKWFFSFSSRDPQADDCVWSGGEGDVDLTPLSSRTSAECPFCGEKTTVTKSMLLIRSASDDWSVTTDEGTYSPENDETVEGVSSRAIRTATCTDKTRLPEFVIAVQSLRVQVTLPNDATAYVSNGRSVVEIKTNGRKDRKPVIIEGDSITVQDPDTTMTVSNDNLAVVVTAPQATVSLVPDALDVAVTTPAGSENFSVTPDRPRQEITAVNDDVKVSDATDTTNAVAPSIPTELEQQFQTAVLPPAEERDLSNAEYAQFVATATTTTTLARTSTTVSRATTTTVRSGTSVTTVSPTPNVAAGPTSSISTSTTTTVPTAEVRIVIEDGEGGIRFYFQGNPYPDSWGDPRWFPPSNDQAVTEPGRCGPSYSSLCNGKVYRVPVGQQFIFDWTLYNDNYLYEMQCGAGTAWFNPGSTSGSGSETRSHGRCDFIASVGSITITTRQR